MSTKRETIKIIANTIVIRSRFFSIMLVPDWEEYSEDAIASETPVPLPECSMIKAIRPTPEMTSKIMNNMTNAFKTNSFSYKLL